MAVLTSLQGRYLRRKQTLTVSQALSTDDRTDTDVSQYALNTKMQIQFEKVQADQIEQNITNIIAELEANRFVGFTYQLSLLIERWKCNSTYIMQNGENVSFENNVMDLGT